MSKAALFELDMASSGITLLEPGTGERITHVALDAPDFVDRMDALRQTCLARGGPRFRTRLMVPAEQVLLRDEPLPRAGRQEAALASAAAQTGLAPEELTVLVGPERTDGAIFFAAVPASTIAEAEEFARGYGLHPVEVTAAVASAAFGRTAIFARFPPPPRPRPKLRRLAAPALGLVVALGAALGAAWWWTASPPSAGVAVLADTAELAVPRPLPRPIALARETAPRPSAAPAPFGQATVPPLAVAGPAPAAEIAVADVRNLPASPVQVGARGALPGLDVGPEPPRPSALTRPAPADESPERDPFAVFWITATAAPDPAAPIERPDISAPPAPTVPSALGAPDETGRGPAVRTVPVAPLPELPAQAALPPRPESLPAKPASGTAPPPPRQARAGAVPLSSHRPSPLPRQAAAPTAEAPEAVAAAVLPAPAPRWTAAPDAAEALAADQRDRAPTRALDPLDDATEPQSDPVAADTAAPAAQLSEVSRPRPRPARPTADPAPAAAPEAAPQTSEAPEALAAPAQSTSAARPTPDDPRAATTPNPLAAPSPADPIAAADPGAEPPSTAPDPSGAPDPALASASLSGVEPAPGAAPDAAPDDLATDQTVRRVEPGDPRPRPRPDSVQSLVVTEPSVAAVDRSSRPRPRPDTLERAAAQEVARRDASAASVASTAAPAVDGRDVSLIGIYGSPQRRRALLRLPGGRYLQVTPGQSFQGWRVAAISDDTLRLDNGSSSHVLTMP